MSSRIKQVIDRLEENVEHIPMIFIETLKEKD
jgi:hypothetical protein